MTDTGLGRYVAGWAPEPLDTAGRIDAWPAAAFAGLLDQPSPVAAAGDPLPPLWHWLHLLDHPAQAALGEDGHPEQGRFLPPLPDRRRMIAGGRLEVREPLRIGDEVVRRSSLVAATPKSGRSGEMVLVTVRHEIVRTGAVTVVEEQDFAYRSQPAGVPRGIEPAATGTAAGPGPTEPDAWSIRLVPDEAMLFRFSALTYNTHRIHYDHPYVTGVEGYPGLVVHGPLLALMLLELPRRFAPERRLARFDYRLRSPAYAGTPIVATGTPAGELAAGAAGRPPSVTGSAEFA